MKIVIFQCVGAYVVVYGLETLVGSRDVPKDHKQWDFCYQMNPNGHLWQTFCANAFTIHRRINTVLWFYHDQVFFYYKLVSIFSEHCAFDQNMLKQKRVNRVVANPK